MPGRTGCCRYNLAKLDPATGAIISTAMIHGDRTRDFPAIREIEVLKGTNDLLCHVDANNANNQSLVRVSTGNTPVDLLQSWFYLGLTPLTSSLTAGLVSRYFGTDGTNIVLVKGAVGATAGLVGLDYSGNVVWSILQDTPTELFVTSFGAQIFNTSNSLGAIRTILFNASTGALLSTSIDLRTNGSPPTHMHAIEQSSGYFVLNQWFGPSTTSSKLLQQQATPTNLTTISEATNALGDAFAISRLRNTSGSSSVISGIFPTSFERFCNVFYTSRGDATNTMPQIWVATTAFSHALLSTDTDNDATGVYFSSKPITTNINAYKRDLTYGNTIWGQTIDFKNTSRTTGTGSNAYCCCIGEDGYLYVGGDPS